MAKELKTGSFKKGELVRVVNPLAFVRCGYPIDPAAQSEHFQEAFASRIREFLRIDGLPDPGEYGEDWLYPVAAQQAAKALTAQWIHSNGFGGRERSIYTIELPEIKGRVFRVLGWHFNVTGEYCAPSYQPASWHSPEEYEPGYLNNARTHRTLHLESASGVYVQVKIEACHVEKVEG